MSQLGDLYKAVGKEKFGAKVSEIAPYFATILPEFVELKASFCEVKIENRKEIHNHIGTVHAIAMCNAAELVAGLMTDVSLPPGRRWIPVGMSVRYLAKAKTDIRAIADGKDVDWSGAGDIEIPVSIFDTNGTEVFLAKITMNVKMS